MRVESGTLEGLLVRHSEAFVRGTDISPLYLVGMVDMDGGKRPFYRHAYIYYNLFSPRSVALCHVQQLQVVVERLLLLTDHKPLVSQPYTSLSGSVCLEWVSKARCVCDCTLVLVQKVVLYIT